MVAHAGTSLPATRSLWFAVLAGPLAWVMDESIGLLVEVNVCSGPIHQPPVALVHATQAITSLVALGVVALGVIAARRWLRDMEARGEPVAVAVDRTRFLAHAGLLLAALGTFGIVLRLISSLTSPVCG
jgi:hypothetical protein